MTWQRIDEDTYIDDTLVTCAEYQLFIDEMREQGKYYQPDHWISYQFPEGQAREPILGVRHSDAVAFCEWLTEHEGGEWYFRLPTQEETNIFPVKPTYITRLGYWQSEKVQFTWVGDIPKDHLDLDRAIDLARDRKRAIDLARDRKRAIDLDRAIDLARDRATDRKRAIDLALLDNREFDHAIFYNYKDDFYFVLLTLQERIAGRSPAFEGIRLVKERIR